MKIFNRETPIQLGLDKERFEAEKEYVVNELLQENRARFELWQGSHPQAQFGEISEDILPIMIPKRAYEIAEDPKQVKIFKLGSNKQGQGFFVYGAQNAPAYGVDDKEQESGFVKFWQKLVKDRKIPANTKPLFTASLVGYGKFSKLINLDDYDGLAFGGLGRDFMNNHLSPVLKKMGYRAWNAQSAIHAVGFYEKIGGIKLSELKTKYWQELVPGYDPNPDDLPSEHFVFFLDEEDKEKLLNKKKSNTR